MKDREEIIKVLAEKVMGWEWADNCGCWFTDDTMVCSHVDFAPDSNSADCDVLIEAFVRNGGCISIDVFPYTTMGVVRATTERGTKIALIEGEYAITKKLEAVTLAIYRTVKGAKG